MTSDKYESVNCL